ncbi:uncharacterized protein LAESUDRAFT_812045 [Laetiporus sulphureus 93-53]|uniref:Uncharacterized protein n=1 Tax=Laetiporus sulphureus 93-53 TaxID=1314785 RepID=A0A165EMF9_9APHY|nr:uncharacterized protein LAESUDRAFT_812045 [Laetiporus sulphureus 93-53]KZT07368.1 hypothetical protein LAESUDRAFT_812045 [Laetiporus sulphureus 93-53]
MGNKRHQDLAKVIEERDAQIAALELQLQLTATHASQMHARLLSALDTIDSLHITHRKEIEAERRSGERVRDKLERCLRYIKEAQGDWDDIREALAVVLEKVEAANDYSLWPHSRLTLMTPLDPIPTRTTGNAEQADADTLNYAKAIVASLRSELESERRAHAQTREHAEAEVLSLTARLARREAELEARDAHLPSPPEPLEDELLLHGETRSPGRPTTSDRERASSHKPLRYTQEQAVQILEISASRNRELEAEVKGISERLEHARLSESTSTRRANSSPSLVSTAVSSLLAGKSPPAEPMRTSEAVAAGNTYLAVQNVHSQLSPVVSIPPSPGLHARSAQLSPSPYTLPPLNLAAAAATAPNPPDSLLERWPELQRLNDEIKLFSSQIDAFHAERDALKTTLADGKDKNLNGAVKEPNGDEERDKECERLKETVNGLKRAIRGTREFAESREREFRDEIAGLRLELEEATNPPKVDASAAAEDVAVQTDALEEPAPALAGTGTRAASAVWTGNLLNGDEEQPMDLASPLLPTILSVHEPEARRSLPQETAAPSEGPPEPPTNLSPDIPSWLLPSVSSPPLGDLLPDWPSLLSPLNLEQEIPGHEHGAVEGGRMEAIERELAAAREELRDKDTQLGELREVMEDLRAVVYAGAEDSDANADADADNSGAGNGDDGG